MVDCIHPVEGFSDPREIRAQPLRIVFHPDPPAAQQASDIEQIVLHIMFHGTDSGVEPLDILNMPFHLLHLILQHVRLSFFLAENQKLFIDIARIQNRRHEAQRQRGNQQIKRGAVPFYKLHRRCLEQNLFNKVYENIEGYPCARRKEQKDHFLPFHLPRAPF